jgi:hypothetical protein
VSARRAGNTSGTRADNLVTHDGPVGTRARRVTVLVKKQSRDLAQGVCERYAMRIRADDGISDVQKIAIGVRPLNRGRSKINCPQSSPLLGIVRAKNTIHVLCYKDTQTPESPAKPFGATELRLFVAIGGDEAVSVDHAKLVGKFTRNPIEVTFDHKHDRQRATYWARWASRRGEVGPWSLPVAMSIAA